MYGCHLKVSQLQEIACSPLPFFKRLGPTGAEEVARGQIARLLVMLTRFVFGLAVAVAGPTTA